MRRGQNSCWRSPASPRRRSFQPRRVFRAFPAPSARKCGGSASGVRSGPELMDDGDPHDQISRLEEDIEQYSKIIERCRKIILASKVAIPVGAVVIVAM